MKPDGGSVGSGVKFAADRLIDLRATWFVARSRGPAASARGTGMDRDGRNDMGLDIRIAEVDVDMDAGDRWPTVVEQPSRLRRLCSKVNVPNMLFQFTSEKP